MEKSPYGGRFYPANTAGLEPSQACHMLMNHIHDNIQAWNDDPHRTKEDVILALKRAAEEES